MRVLLFLCFLVYSNAQIEDLGKGVLVHLGPLDTSHQIGNLSSHYLPLDPDDDTSSQNAAILLEDLRRLFKVGFNVYPPLDPYTRQTLPPLNLDDYLDSVKGEVDFTNLVIAGAQQFEQQLLELRLRSGRIDFGFTIPTLNFDVDFEANLLLANVSSLNFSGHLSLVLSGVNVTGAVHAIATNLNRIGKHYYQFVALYYHLHIEDVAVQLQGSNDTINKLIKEGLLIQTDVAQDIVVPNILDKLIYNLNRNAATVVLEEVNRMLLIANSEQVMAYLLPKDL